MKTKNNIFILLLLAFAFANPIINAKNIQDNFNLVDKFDIPFTFSTPLTLSFCYHKNNFYFISKEQDVTADTNFNVFYYSIDKKQLDTMIVKFPVEHFTYKNYVPERIKKEMNIDFDFIESKFELSSFAISDNYLIISGMDRFLIYNKKNDEFVFSYVISAEDVYGHNDQLCFSKLKIVDNILLGYRCTLGDAGAESFLKQANDTQLVSTAIMKYDLKNKKLLNFKMVYPEPKGFAFLNFAPRENIDCNGNFYIISDVTEYNLYLYDTDWNLTDKISPNHSTWIIDEKLPDARTVATACRKFGNTATFDLVSSFLHTTSLTYNVMFLNDETILVDWSVPYSENKKERKMFYDIFKIKDGKLLLLNTFEQGELNKNSEKTFGEANTYALQMPRDFYLFDNYLFFISQSTPFDIFSPEIQKLPLKDYYEKLDDYFIDNPTKSSVIIYKWKN